MRYCLDPSSRARDSIRAHRIALLAAMTWTATACAAPGQGQGRDRATGGAAPSARDSARAEHALGRLTARVSASGGGTRGAAGRHTIGSGSARAGIIVVPASYDPARPARLMLLLHGAGGAGASMLRRIPPLPDSLNTIVVAPDSRAPTWDFIRGPFGPDVAFIDSVLHAVFAQYRVDSTRVTVAGFSDGASYGLSLGMTNGDLFSRVIAFSPGMDGVIAPVGRPRIFVSHGTRDQVLAIDRTSRVIVPRLRARGYDMTYREFEGPHDLPEAVTREALRWLEGSGSAP